MATVPIGRRRSTRVAVFKIGQNLSLLQPYTSDLGALRRAVDRATSVGDVIPRSLTEDLLRAQERLRRLTDGGGPAGPMPGMVLRRAVTLLSSLVVIRRAELAAAAEADPLRLGDLRVVPNLDAPLSKGTAANLSFFVMLSPGPGPAPRLTLELEHDGRIVARGEPPLPARDADGWIRCVAILPSGSLPPGRYEARARASQSGSEAEATTILNLAP